MRPSRGMGAINPSKMPKAKKIIRKDDPNVVTEYKSGGLYENINAKRKRIAGGSKERMRSIGQAGAPTAQDFKQSAKTAKKA